MGRIRGQKGSYYGQYEGWQRNCPTSSVRPLLPEWTPAATAGPTATSNEFVTAILQDRKPLVDIAQALNMTVAGIVAHECALKGGELKSSKCYDAAFRNDPLTRTICLIKVKSMNNPLSPAQQFLWAQPLKLFIGGRWVESQSGKTFETLDPGEGKGTRQNFGGRCSGRGSSSGSRARGVPKKRLGHDASQRPGGDSPSPR